MISLTSFKMRSFSGSFTGKPGFIINSSATSYASLPDEALNNTDGGSSEAEDLRWDEYLNPYIADDTVH
jgi:hypothetical protein